jgi:hypothetical protein
MNTSMQQGTVVRCVRATEDDWRTLLRRKIVWLLAAKLVALVVLWSLFFSPAHRVEVTAENVGRMLAIEEPAGAPAHDSSAASAEADVTSGKNQ